MPPRFAYWTILAGGLPTAFRATHREELLPTFQRLREKHPDAEMKWFARGKLWESPEEAREASTRARSEPQGDRRGRGRDWRPGGEHRDPRQPYKDAKQARNQRWRQQKFERKRPASTNAWPPRDDRPSTAPPRTDRPPRNRPPMGGNARDNRFESRAPSHERRDRPGHGPRESGRGKFKPWPRNDREPFGQRKAQSRDKRWESRPRRERPDEDPALKKPEVRQQDGRPPKRRAFERSGFDRNRPIEPRAPRRRDRPPSSGKKRDK